MKYEYLRRWLGTLIMVVLILIFIYCLAGIQEQKSNGKLFFPFGYRPVVILSGSMEETIRTGAVVLVKQTKEIAPEDILFFITKDQIPVIHRCIHKNEDGSLITKGDANDEVDFEPVTSSQIQGKVVCVMNWLAPVFTKNRVSFRKIP